MSTLKCDNVWHMTNVAVLCSYPLVDYAEYMAHNAEVYCMAYNSNV